MSDRPLKAVPLVPAKAYRPLPDELPPPLPVDVSLGWCDYVLDRLGPHLLAGIPSSTTPTVCDVATRDEYLRCDQCKRWTRRLWSYRGRLLLCRSCTRGRVRVGEQVRRWREAA